MSAEQNKALMQRFVKAKDAADYKPLLAPNFVLHQSDGPHGVEAFLQHITYFNSVFSDTHFEVEEQVAEGDTVVTRGIWSGTHTSEFQGLPPTGRQIAISAVLFDRIVDDKIVEHRGQFDMLAGMQQLGAVPAS